MKRGIKLLILVFILALLAGAAVALTKSGKAAAETESASGEDSFALLELASGDIRYMNWTVSGSTDVNSFENLGEVWTYLPDSSLTVDNDVLNTMAASFAPLTAYRKIEDPDTASVYGLEEPAAVIELTASDGSVYTITVGNMTSISGRRYVSIGDGAVYTVSSTLYSTFNYGASDLTAAADAAAE